MTVIDSRDLGRIRGFDIRAELHPDPDTRPQDLDCYTSADIQAWQHDQWSYVTTKITAARAGVELGAAYLSGSEHGYLPGVDRQVSPLDGDGEAFVNGYGPGLIDEAITEAEKDTHRNPVELSQARHRPSRTRSSLDMNHVDQHAVSSALNSAVDEVAELATLPDTGTVDALNLVVNIALHRLFTDPQATVQDVVADCYSATTVSEIVDWIGS